MPIYLMLVPLDSDMNKMLLRSQYKPGVKNVNTDYHPILLTVVVPDRPQNALQMLLALVFLQNPSYERPDLGPLVRGETTPVPNLVFRNQV